MSIKLTKIFLDGGREELFVPPETNYNDIQKIFQEDDNIHCLAVFENKIYKSSIQNFNRSSILEMQEIIDN